MLIVVNSQKIVGAGKKGQINYSGCHSVKAIQDSLFGRCLRCL